jgi:hypothetical protein
MLPSRAEALSADALILRHHFWPRRGIDRRAVLPKEFAAGRDAAPLRRDDTIDRGWLGAGYEDLQVVEFVGEPAEFSEHFG